MVVRQCCISNPAARDRLWNLAHSDKSSASTSSHHVIESAQSSGKISWSAFVAIFSLISEYKHECMAAYSLPQKLAAICNTHEQLSLSEPDSGQNNAVKWYIIWQITIFGCHLQTQLKKCFLKVLFASQRLFDISYCLSRHMPCRVFLDIIYYDFWWFYFIFTLTIVHMVWEIAFLGICLSASYVLNFSVIFSDLSEFYSH